VSITKVVVLLTAVPTKISLDFSEFSTSFYAFYKIQQIAYTSEDTLLHRSPWKEMRARNWVPRPWEAAGSPEIRRLRRRSRPGKGSGSRACSPSVDWRFWLGWRGCRRGGSATAGGGCRGGLGLRRGEAHERQCANLGGSTGPRGESEAVGRRRERAALQAHRRRRQWRAAAVWRAEGANGGA
jgi:hypothetical protein